MFPSPRNISVMNCIFNVPQNGVVDSSTCFGASGNSSTQLKTHNGHGVDGQKRPKSLQMAANTDGYMAKKSLGSHDNDEGSLPCTPEPDDDMGRCSAGDAALDSETHLLISCYLLDFITQAGTRYNDSKSLVTMKRVVGGLLEKHRYAYNGMINKLSQEERKDGVWFVKAVAKSVFKDGNTNWGRIASLVAFGAVVCQHMKQMGREDDVELVAQEISEYLLTDQRDWLLKNNSWDGFVEFFRVSDPEATVRNTLLGLAGVAGIGALALLIK